MNLSETKALHKKYATDDEAFAIVFTHCETVAEIALWCVKNSSISCNKETLSTAAMLHDIATYSFWNPKEKIFEMDTYKLHTIYGAALLAEEGLPERLFWR